MTANVWNPNPNTVSQVNANGLIKQEQQTASNGQTVFTLTTFAYAVNTGSLLVFKNGSILGRIIDYIETGITTITLVNPSNIGDKYLFIGIVSITGTSNTDNVLRTDLSSGTGDVIIGHTDNGGTPTTVKNKLCATASDSFLESSKPCYATVAVNVTRTTIDRHAFEDWSTLNTTDFGQGYSSFDAKVSMTTQQNQNHLVGYQSRSTFSGANTLGYFHGYDTAMVHNGAGEIANVAGIRLFDIGGTGPITFHAALWINQITRGSTKYAIFSDGGNVHQFGGPTGTVITGDIQAKSLNFGVDTVGKSITYGYGTTGTTNFGSHVFFDGKTTPVATLDKNGLLLAGVISLVNYTYAQLVMVPVGSIAFCTNGRKVGEGIGAGTGVPVYYTAGNWRVFSTDAPVTI